MWSHYALGLGVKQRECSELNQDNVVEPENTFESSNRRQRKRRSPPVDMERQRTGHDANQHDMGCSAHLIRCHNSRVGVRCRESQN